MTGLSPVSVEGIENFDITGIIKGHNQYADKISEILAYVNFNATPNEAPIASIINGSKVEDAWEVSATTIM